MFKEFGIYNYDNDLNVIVEITENEIIGIDYDIEDYYDFMEAHEFEDEEIEFNDEITEDYLNDFLYENYDQIGSMQVFKIYKEDMYEGFKLVGNVNDDPQFKKLLKSFAYAVLGIK